MSVVGQRPVSEAVDGSVPGEDGDRRSASARETAVALVVVLAFVPFLMLLARYLWSRPHYQFFPLILVGFVLLVRSRWTENEPSAEARHDRLSSLLLQSGLVSLAGCSQPPACCCTLADPARFGDSSGRGACCG